MGITLSATLGNRPAFVSATYTAIALVFFFGIGLAGGTAYKWLASDGAVAQVADRVATPPVAEPTLPATVAQAPGEIAPSMAAPRLAQVTPSAPPSVAQPPAPVTVAAATPTPSDATPQAAADTPAPVPYLAVEPQARAARSHTAAQHRIVAAPKKPRIAAKTVHAAVAQTVALHAPPAAPANLAGPYRIQFGAFANEDNARRVQWAVEATGLKVDVAQAPGAGGHRLYYLRSPSYRDYAAALSAAQTVQDRVQHFVNAIPIDYAILGDRPAIEQQAQAR